MEFRCGARIAIARASLDFGQRQKALKSIESGKRLDTILIQNL
jgi:hypothetical protein